MTYLKLKPFILFFLVGMLCMGGCSQTPDLIVSFKDIQGLTKGDAVIQGIVDVGSVLDVTYTQDGNFLVGVKFNERNTIAMTEFTQFYIGPSPVSDEKKVLMVTHTQKGGTPLQKGATVQGTPKKELIPSLFNSFQNFIEKFQKIPQSEEFKALEKKLDDLGQELEKSGKSFKEKIQTDLIPRLEQELEELQKKLNNGENKKDTRPLEDKLQQLKKI